MKTINGKNKLERLINKAYKYLNITLKKASNKYLYIEKVAEKENEMVSNCHQLKLKAADGGMGADTKTTN